MSLIYKNRLQTEHTAIKNVKTRAIHPLYLLTR